MVDFRLVAVLLAAGFAADPSSWELSASTVPSAGVSSAGVPFDPLAMAAGSSGGVAFAGSAASLVRSAPAVGRFAPARLAGLGFAACGSATAAGCVDSVGSVDSVAVAPVAVAPLAVDLIASSFVDTADPMTEVSHRAPSGSKPTRR